MYPTIGRGSNFWIRFVNIFPGAWMLVSAQHHQCHLHLKWHWHYWRQWRCLVSDHLFFSLHSQNVFFLTTYSFTFQRRWGIPGIGYLQRGKNRPKLLYIKDSRHVVAIWNLSKSSKLKECWFCTMDLDQPLFCPGTLSFAAWHTFVVVILICRDLLMENWFFLDAPRWTAVR